MHNIEYRTYPENVDKVKAKADLDHYVSMEDWQEGCSGLYNPIRWIDKILSSREEAEKFLEANDRRDYDNLAVKYRETTVSGKQYSALVEKLKKAKKELEEVNSKFHFRDAKADFIGCKTCGSKLSRKHLFTNKCPVCGFDLRPAYVQEKVKKLEEKAKKYQEDLKNLPLKPTGRVSWLLKFEYHT